MPIHPAPNVVIAERFRLNRLLGRGGMGSVWHATHLGLDVPCAVKFIEGEGAELPEVQGRFEREAKAAAQLRSPHVVQILDHGVCNGTPYIAMELLDGEDLGKRLTRLGRLPPQDLLWIVTQVGRALTRAHAVGIVHRDLKPDNIFLVHDDDREIAKVLDFGIAKAIGPGAPGASTRTGAMLGTPYYMSPEQAQGTKAVDSRSDLWSLGVIVFEALTGQRPFESEALGDLLMKIIIAPIPHPSHVARDLPPGLDAWWARASHRDPAQRFQSAKDLCDSIAIVFGRSSSDLGDAAPRPDGASAARPERGPHWTDTPMGGSPPTFSAPAPQQLAGVATGAPIAHTFAARPPGVKGRMAMIVAIGGGLVVLGAGIVAVSLAVKGKETTPVAATMGSVMSVADAMASAPPVAAVLVNVPETVAPAPAPVGAPQTDGASVRLEHAGAGAHGQFPGAKQLPSAKAPPAARPPPAAIAPPAAKPLPPTSPAPAETKKKPVDLGI
jgi:hypothetical protein